MAEFYIEKKASETGEHVVHSSKCSSMPAKDNMQYLGLDVIYRICWPTVMNAKH